MRQLFATLNFCFFTCFCLAQNLPVSNIYLLQIDKQDTLMVFRSPKHLTDFNKNGYNNQPSFLSNTELIFSAALTGENQTDVYLLDLQKNTRLRMTRTPESEYSPMVTPENLFFSVVRVETDADRSQRLWQYPLDRKDKGKPVFRYLRGIGYYHWIDRGRVALFNVADVNYMSVGNLQDETTRHLAPNIGRCFQMSPNGRLVFVHKVTPDRWVIKAMDKTTLAVDEIVETISGVEDFAILKDGTIVMGKKSRLYKFHPKQDKKWAEVADLKRIGITNISRLAASADNKLAIVNGAD